MPSLSRLFRLRNELSRETYTKYKGTLAVRAWIADAADYSQAPCHRSPECRAVGEGERGPWWLDCLSPETRRRYEEWLEANDRG